MSLKRVCAALSLAVGLAACDADIVGPLPQKPAFVAARVNQTIRVFAGVPLWNVTSSNAAVATAWLDPLGNGAQVKCLAIGSSTIIGTVRTWNVDLQQFQFTLLTVTVDCHEQGNGG
jgi:hypothetical protein